ALTVLVAVLASYYTSKVAMAHGRDLRREVFVHVQKFGLKEFDELGAASLITRTTNDITQIQQVMMMIFRMILRASLMIIVGIVMSFSIDAKLTLVINIVMPFLLAAELFILINNITLLQAVHKHLDRFNLVMRENLAGVRVIRALNKQTTEANKLKPAHEYLT